MTYTIRKTTVEDIPIIVHHRKRMFIDMGLDERTVIETLAQPFAAWVPERLENGQYQGWFAIGEDGQVIAGAGLLIYEWLPSPATPRGYILNVYTEPVYRQQGIARRLIEEILKYCRAQGLTQVLLHASAQGRAIYEALGFEQSNEMRIRLE
jgi:GNAT superfamily N-acetyltransferase